MNLIGSGFSSAKVTALVALAAAASGVMANRAQAAAKRCLVAPLKMWRDLPYGENWRNGS